MRDPLREPCKPSCSSVQVPGETKEKERKGIMETTKQQQREMVFATGNNKEGKYPPCQHCGRKNHPHFKCWRKPDMKCRKCHKLGHAEIICKEKGLQQPNDAQIADQQEDEQLFVATCFASKNSSESWLVDSGCTNDMTSDEKLFRELDRSVKSRVRIENREYLPAKGKGTAIESHKDTKLIYEVLFVPEIDQNLLSVGQLLENGLKLLFEDKACLISDPSGQEIFRIKMQGKSFSLNPLNEEHNFSKPAHCSGNVAQNVGALSSQSFIVYAKEQNGKWFTQHGGEHFKL